MPTIPRANTNLTTAAIARARRGDHVSRRSVYYLESCPRRCIFTDSDEANRLIAQEPLALLIGFALDQQVTVPTGVLGPAAS